MAWEPRAGNDKRGTTMQAAIVVTFTRPIVGRESKALAYGAEVNDFWGARAREGKCTEPELFITEAGSGMWMVKGDRDVLMQIHDSDEARMLTLKGEILLESFCLEFFVTGDSANDYMMRYQSALAAIG